jgi:hypothetical protein
MIGCHGPVISYRKKGKKRNRKQKNIKELQSWLNGYLTKSMMMFLRKLMHPTISCIYINPKP